MRDAESPSMEALMRELAPSLVLYARQWCDCPEDVVQEAFLKFSRQKPPPENPRAWLFHVVRNEAISAVRSQKRRKTRETATARDEAVWFLRSHENQLDADDATETLRALPDELRETVIAKLWGDMSFDEVGLLTNTSASTAYRRYAEALRIMRERLGVSCEKAK